MTTWTKRNAGLPMDQIINGYRIHYGEYTGMWWASSLTNMLDCQFYRTRNEAVAWASR